VEGQRCDQCKENKYDRQRGCINCPDCYNLVSDAVQEHRYKLDKLVELLSNITETPTVIDDVDFERKLNEVQQSVNKLWNDAKKGAGSNFFNSMIWDLELICVFAAGDKTLLERLKDLKTRLQAVGEIHKNITMFTEGARVHTKLGERNATLVEESIERSREALKVRSKT
jgi:laminin, gamma 1